MKIGIFSETYQPTINGVVTSIDSFKNELEKRGHQYYIFTPYNAHHPQMIDHVYRFPAVHFPHDKIYPLAIPMPFSLAKYQLPLDIIRDLDIIHIQHFALMGQYGLGCAKLFSIPSIYTYHTMAELYTHYIPAVGSAFNPLVRAITRYTANHADHVIAPTPSVKSYLRSIGVKQSVSVIPTGIDTSKYKKHRLLYIQHKYSLPLDSEILLYVGRLAEEKNINFLLQSFRRVADKNPRAHLVMAGSGPDQPKVEQFIVQHRLKKRVSLLGFLDHAEIRRLFGSADLFLFPSITDTQGIVILEAMASGAVPVAIDMLGPGDLIIDRVSGRLSDLNEEHFAGIILELLADPRERKQLARAAQERAAIFDQSKTADLMEELYEKFTSRHRSRSAAQAKSQKSHRVWA